jgi:hypothetical protein
VLFLTVGFWLREEPTVNHKPIDRGYPLRRPLTGSASSRGFFAAGQEFGHLRAEPALECGGLTPPFSLNMLGLGMPHRCPRR